MQVNSNFDPKQTFEDLDSSCNLTHVVVALLGMNRQRHISDPISVQWMGQESLHQALEGRLLLVHLLCKVGSN